MTHRPHQTHQPHPTLTRAALLATCLLLTACASERKSTTTAAPAPAPGVVAPSPAPAPAAPQPAQPTVATPPAPTAPEAPTQTYDLEARATHLKAATHAFNTQDFPTAIREYEAAIRAGADTSLVHFRYGYALHVTGRPKDALPHHLAATNIANPALKIDALYNAACAYALTGQRADALTYLTKAIDAGFKDAKQVAKDTDLDSLRDDPEFKKIIASIPTT